MSSRAGLSLSRSFALACFLALATSLANGQITDANDTTSTPIEGAGHDYIRALSETVNPANGSVSLRINVPVAKGRGLTIPFSFGYDSNGSRHLKADYYPNYGTAIWVSNTGYTGQGGWVYSIPQLNWDSWTGSQAVVTGYNSNGPIYTFYYCYYATAYTLRDGLGGVHALGLGTRWFDSSGESQYCTGSSTISGGDPQVRAALTAPPQVGAPGFYYQGPVVVYEPDGTVYNFSLSASVPGSDATHYVLPTSIEDRNGNIITVSGSTFTDTLGRTLFSGALGSAGQTKTVSISGINYQVTWKSVTASYAVSQVWAGQSNTPWSCYSIPAVSDTQTVVSKITLPNGQAYNFYYGNDVTPNNATTNSYGLLSEIDYPSGGWAQYTWKPSDTMNELADYPGVLSNTCNAAGGYCPAPSQDGCLYQYKTPVVASRKVSFGGSTAALTQTFIYSTAWDSPINGNALGITWNSKTTNVTTTDNVLGKSYLTKYTYGFVNAPQVPLIYATLPQQIPVESTTKYYDWGNTTSPTRTVTKTWNDQYDLASEVVLQGTQSSKITYCYVGTNCVPASNTFSQLQEKDEFDFGATSASRKTVTTYQSFSGTPGTIADAPCKTVLYDGNNNRYAETDYLYDGGSTLCGTTTSSAATTGVTVVSGTHDESLFGPSKTTPRGDVTQKTQWASTGTSPVTTYAYDETGQVLTMKEPCGITICSDIGTLVPATQYFYADSYATGSSTCTSANGPAGNTNALLTKVTYPPTNGVVHSECFSYDYNSGQLTGSKDENGQLTTYTYSDPFLRPTQVNYPDGGQITLSYNDTPPSPAVTASKLISSGVNLTTTSVMDGMGHVTQTQVTSDPEGTDSVDTTYDGTNHVYTRSNPHRSSTSSTDGTTTFSYDALGRPITVAEPDGSQVTTSYSSNCATVTDEAGKARKSCVDGLGRMTGVWEDPSGLDYETDYTYDVLGNLTYVNQKGSSVANARTRTFQYDSLSHLTSAQNPESGTVTYAYDGNSNLTTKTAPAPNQTGSATVTTSYSYDALNRLVGKSYSDGTTPGEFYYYDVAPGWMTDLKNVVGRLANSNNQYGGGYSGKATAATYSYDAMGRVVRKWSQTPSISAAGKFSYSTFDLAGNLTSTTSAAPTTISYAYDGASRLTAVTSSWPHPTTLYSIDASLGYYPNGAIRKALFGNGLTETFAYNNRLQPCRMNINSSGGYFSHCTDSAPSGNVLDFTIGYNAGSADNGNVVSWSAVGNQTFSRSNVYDHLNRIQSMSDSASGQACKGLSWTVDAWGNLTAQTNTSGTCYGFSAAVGTNNQLVGYQYDAAGNMTYDGFHYYTYDAENRISQVDSGSTASYIYDENGQRVRKNAATGWTEYFYGPNGSVEAEYNGTAWPAQYVYAGSKLIAQYANNETEFVHSDHLGSTRLVTNVTSPTIPVDNLDYLPFGQQTAGATMTTHKFTGKERDSESGLDNFGARYYGSSFGRFMTPDWAASPEAVPYANLEYPQTLNLYSYAGNNPLSRKDADGHFWEELGNLFKYGHYVNNEGLEGALQKDADTARSQIAGMKNFTVNGKSPSDALKGLSNRQTVDLNHSITNFLSSQVMTSLMGGSNDPNVRVGIVFPVGAAAFEEGAATEYTIQTARGALATDVRTNITAQEFGSNLEASGYTKSVAKDGVTSIYSKGNQVYSIYPNARSTGGAAANLAVDGRVVTKIRLQ